MAPKADAERRERDADPLRDLGYARWLSGVAWDGDELDELALQG